MDLKNFAVKLTKITLTILILGLMLFSLVIPGHYLPVFPLLLLFFFAITLIIYRYQLNLAKKDMGKFTRSVMVVTFLKLVLYSVVAVVYIALKPENALPFVIGLMALYLIYTIFEVAEISKISRTQQNK